MINKAIIIGNLGADPDIRTTQDGRKIAILRVATSESWKDKQTGERKERTEWHRVSIFSEGLAFVAEKYLHKGSKIYIEGKIQTRKWTDQNGQDRYTTEIVVQGYGGTLVLLDRPQSSQNEQQTAQQQAPSSLASDLDDDLPF